MKSRFSLSDFFKKFGVPVMSVKALFNFVTDKSITDENIEHYLETAEKIALQSEWGTFNLESSSFADEIIFLSYPLNL